MTNNASGEKEESTLNSRRSIQSTRWTICGSLRTLTGNVLIPRKPLYTPLPYPNSIRLLRIHAGETGQRIRCSLQIARFDEGIQPYEAISYVWLLKKGERSIVCNGHKKNVPMNLFDALERLRYPGRSRLIWVDNLCICQENSTEKNHQVRQMHKVYRNAKRVIVWLGTDEYDEAHSAFAILCALVNTHRQGENAVSYSTISKQQLDGIHCMSPPPPLESKEWYAVVALFTNEWFLRMWVLQEIVLAQEATFIWGQAELDWRIIGDAIDTIRGHLPQLNHKLENRAYQNAYIMNHLGKLQLSKLKSAHPFLHLLDLSRSFDVTFAKDKVYGLLGFPTKDTEERGHTSFVPPDYECSLAEIYTYVARTIIQEKRNLDVLSFTSHTNPKFTERLAMPSWVPDWSSKDVVYPFMGFGQQNQHTAGKSKELEVLKSENTGVLCLKGVEVYVVADSLPPMPFTELQNSTPHLKDLVEWCVKHALGVTLSVLATTLTAGRDTNGSLIADPKQHLADFISLLMELDPNHLQSAYLTEAPGLSKLEVDEGNPDRAREALWRYWCYRSPFVTQTGKLGLGSGAVTKGDLVAVLWGGQVPYVLREVEGCGYWFIGECYIEGLMKGEVADKLKDEDGFTEKVFELR